MKIDEWEQILENEFSRCKYCKAKHKPGNEAFGGICDKCKNSPTACCRCEIVNCDEKLPLHFIFQRNITYCSECRNELNKPLASK